MTFLYYISLTFFMLLCIVTCGSILVQESKSLGLGSSFGGDPGTSLFGTSTAEVLKKFTAWLGVIFIVSCLLLSFWTISMGSHRKSALPSVTTEMTTEGE